jgi:hypothetical protein
MRCLFRRGVHPQEEAETNSAQLHPPSVAAAAAGSLLAPPANPPPHSPPDRDVAAGAISMSVNFMGTPIFEGSDDLCAKTGCPIAPGPLEIKYVQDLPPIAPPVSAACIYMSSLMAEEGHRGAGAVCMRGWSMRLRGAGSSCQSPPFPPLPPNPNPP